jgi:hypothetical protein
MFKPINLSIIRQRVNTLLSYSYILIETKIDKLLNLQVFLKKEKEKENILGEKAVKWQWNIKDDLLLKV